MERRRLGWTILAVTLCAALVVTFFFPVQIGGRTRPEPRGPDDVTFVTVDADSDALLWPFTSRRRAFGTLTLPVNVVVQGNAHRVRSLLQTGTDAKWNNSTGEWQGFGAEGIVGSEWYTAHGATRYTYVRTVDGSGGGWTTETFQLHHGNYFGTRYHVRAYAGGTGETSWTAMQAHYEHWDWFRLRHTVGSTTAGRRYVERDFYGETAVTSIERTRFGNGGISDADGWATMVVLGPRSAASGANRAVEAEERPAQGGRTSPPLFVVLAVLLLPTGVALARLQRTREWARRPHVRLAGVTVVAFAILPAARWGAISVENALPALSPKVIAAGGYLLIALGLPACAFLAGRVAPPDRGGYAAVGAVAVGILVDYASVGVGVLPVSVVAHRGFLLLTLSAAVATGSREGPGDAQRVAGVLVLWLAVLAWPVLDAL